jgi:hypothetical protein
VSTAAPDLQPQLELEPVDQSALREAYDAAGYRRRGITFARAMASTGLRIALELHAEAIARSKRHPEATA